MNDSKDNARLSFQLRQLRRRVDELERLIRDDKRRLHAEIAPDQIGEDRAHVTERRS